MKTKTFFIICILTSFFLNAQPSDFTEVAKKAIPAVVSIKVEFKRSSGSGNFGVPFGKDDTDPFGDDFWNRFFSPRGRERRETEPTVGQGSGFLVTEDGYILTNNHIVENTDKVVVTLNTGREFQAKVIGRDSNTDVAIIKIEGTSFPFLKFGDSSKLQVGEWVAAIGNPLGLQATLTVGVVSAVDRNNLGLAQVEDFIQTDAAINRGNSGGPLLNMKGEAVGINTAIATQTGGYMGIGFAIPINIAAQVMDQLIKNGSFARGYLGVALQQIDQDLAEAFGLHSTKGALIAEVAKDSPADQAGLKRGDVILKYNGQEVQNISVIRNIISMMKPTDSIKLEIKRGDKIMNIDVKVGAHPMNATTSSTSINQLGIQVIDITPEIAQNLGYVDEKGVVVSQVDPGSIAQLAGIKKGSLIISVNQKEIKTVEEFYKEVQSNNKDKPLLLLLKQGQTTQYISLKTN